MAPPIKHLHRAQVYKMKLYDGIILFRVLNFSQDFCDIINILVVNTLLITLTLNRIVFFSYYSHEMVRNACI